MQKTNHKISKSQLKNKRILELLNAKSSIKLRKKKLKISNQNYLISNIEDTDNIKNNN